MIKVNSNAYTVNLDLLKISNNKSMKIYNSNMNIIPNLDPNIDRLIGNNNFMLPHKNIYSYIKMKEIYNVIIKQAKLNFYINKPKGIIQNFNIPLQSFLAQYLEFKYFDEINNKKDINKLFIKLCYFSIIKIKRKSIKNINFKIAYLVAKKLNIKKDKLIYDTYVINIVKYCNKKSIKQIIDFISLYNIDIIFYYIQFYYSYTNLNYFLLIAKKYFNTF